MKLKRSVTASSDSMREARREMARGGLVCREVAGGQARDAKRLQAPEDLGEGGRARIHAADRTTPSSSSRALTASNAGSS